MSLNFSFVFGNGLLVLICNPFAGLVSRASLRKTNRCKQLVVAGPGRKTLRLQYLLLFIKVTSYVTTVLSSDLLSSQRS